MKVLLINRTGWEKWIDLDENGKSSRLSILSGWVYYSNKEYMRVSDPRSSAEVSVYKETKRTDKTYKGHGEKRDDLQIYVEDK